MMVEELLKPLGYFGLILLVLGGLAAYLGRQYIEHITEIDLLKKSMLHERHVLIVAKLYQKVNDLWRAMGDYIDSRNDGDEQREKIRMEVQKTYKSFVKYYQDKEIWFPKDMCEQFYTLNETMREAFGAQSIAEGPVGQQHPAIAQMGYDKADEAYRQCDKVIRPQIREHFRALLGVKKTNTPQALEES